MYKRMGAIKKEACMMPDVFENARGLSNDDIRRYIEGNAEDANAVNPDDISLLHFAAGYPSNAEIIKVLIEMGADVNVIESNGLTPLHMAVIVGDVEIVEALASGGADVDAVEYNGCTPLHAAASQGFLEIAKILVDGGADISIENNKKQTPLDLARMTGHEEMVKHFLSVGDE
jgi:ankyrin repeat protein